MANEQIHANATDVATLTGAELLAIRTSDNELVKAPSSAATTWTPPDFDGPWTLTCTVEDAAANSDAANVNVDVDFGAGGSPVAGRMIAQAGSAI